MHDFDSVLVLIKIGRVQNHLPERGQRGRHSDALPRHSSCPSGKTPLRAGLWRDTCLGGTYLVSHNNSTGAKFFGLRVGSRVIYGHTWTVWKVHRIAATSWSQPAGPLILQTCTDNSGRTYLIVELR